MDLGTPSYRSNKSEEDRYKTLPWQRRRPSQTPGRQRGKEPVTAKDLLQLGLHANIYNPALAGGSMTTMPQRKPVEAEVTLLCLN